MHDTSVIAVRRWLMASVIAVVATVVLGGITRLTESGLSITTWNPVSGVLPPMTADAWQQAYQAFLQIPQAQTVHRGITLGEFKFIFWWEWIHRLLARGVGLVLALPYVVFFVRRTLPRGYVGRLAALPVLTLAQGALGWFMVASGLVERTSVSQYRLTAHLSLALIILAVALWKYLDLAPERPRDGGAARAPLAPRAWRRAIGTALVLASCTIMAGGFVAGLDAGRIFNTFPLMGGAVIPPGYSQGLSWWRNAFENPVAAQFHHRILGLALGALALTLAWRATGSAMGGETKRAVRRLGGIVLVQVALGVATLLLSVPVTLGVLHQLTGVLVLIAAIGAYHAARTEPGPA